MRPITDCRRPIRGGSHPSIRFLAVWTALSVFLGSAAARADILIPTIYNANLSEGTAQGGQYDYFDDTYRQLVDGENGVNLWKADLGNGAAYEWVGWRQADPIITFEFGEAVTIDEVTIDFNRNEKSERIYLPKIVEIGDTIFHLKQRAIPNETRGAVTFFGSWTGSSLTVQLADHNPNRWIMVDEIGFDGTRTEPTVPEPSAISLLGLGMGYAIFRRRRERLNQTQ